MPHTGIDKEHSTRAKIGTTSQEGFHLIALARDRPQDGPAHPALLYTNRRLSTDSNASFGAFNSHVKTSTTIPRVSKSSPQDHLFNLQQVQRALTKQHNMNLDVTHGHNEHGRSWNDEHRDSPTCRLNQASGPRAKRPSQMTKDSDNLVACDVNAEHLALFDGAINESKQVVTQ